MPDPYLAAALACANLFYDRMFRDWPEAVTRLSGACTLSFSGDTRLTGANHLWPHTPDAITKKTLDEARRFFELFQAAWSVIYTDTFLPGTDALLRQHGYYVRWSSPLMVLDRPPRPVPGNPHVNVIRAGTAQHIKAVALVLAEAFAISESINRRVARVEHLADPGILHYLIYDAGDPAACATVVLDGEMAGIWNVGTRYQFRRQRYATTIMHALLSDLRARGVTVTMLMASDAGRPLYERLGYRQIGLTTYAGPLNLTRLQMR
ncbi:MAG: GNAT family N-acetyltransferase [Anaerolineae bacterium]|nr:GNAT family N-acetyltransferase [Anaerolineae bacterium]